MRSKGGSCWRLPNASNGGGRRPTLHVGARRPTTYHCLDRCELVGHLTSAEVSGETDRVVGYAGLLFG